MTAARSRFQPCVQQIPHVGRTGTCTLAYCTKTPVISVTKRAPGLVGLVVAQVAREQRVELRVVGNQAGVLPSEGEVLGGLAPGQPGGSALPHLARPRVRYAHLRIETSDGQGFMFWVLKPNLHFEP